MLPDTHPILVAFVDTLKNRNIPPEYFDYYKKWLRYFLDFCEKHPQIQEQAEQIKQFLEKLHSKQQSPQYCRQAAHSVSLYFEMRKGDSFSNILPRDSVDTPPVLLTETPRFSGVTRPSQYSAAGYQEKSDSPEWDDVLTKLAEEIKVRHYSRKTLQTYALWSRKFQRYLKNKPPQELTTADVKDYLTYLAMKCHVAASTQNQAFNSILFLFRHGLKREFGELRDVPRAKKSLYIPAVLSRQRSTRF